MERQYSVQFFQEFIANLQRVCEERLCYNQFVEVTGYVSVEIDNIKKERYVLSELLQNNGETLSESFCAKATKQMQHRFERRPLAERKSSIDETYGGCVSLPRTQRCSSKRPSSDQSSIAPESNLYVQSRLSDKEIYSGQGQFKNSDGPSNAKQSRTKRNSDDFNQFNIPRVPTISASLNNLEDTMPHEYTNISLKTDDHNSQTKPSCQFANIEIQYKNKVNSFPQTKTDFPVPIQLFKHEVNPSGCTENPGPTNSFNSPAEEEVVDLDDYQNDDDDLEMMTNTEQTMGLPSYIRKKTQLRPGTEIMMKNSVNQFKRFFVDKYNKDIDLMTCTPEHLNNLLLEYFQEARKVCGGKLKAKSLKCVQERLILYLKEGDYPYSLTKDSEFASSRDYLKQRLLEEGRVACHIYSAVDDNDIEMLFRSGHLGLNSLDSLTNTMWIMNTKLFNIKGPAFHLDLKWGDIALRVTENGEEYLERPLPGSFSLKVFASLENPSRCWVNCYKQFQAFRPKVALDEGYAFYLKHVSGQTTFLSTPMVYYQLSTLWRRIVSSAGLPGNKKIM